MTISKIITLCGPFCFSLLIVNAQDAIIRDAEYFIIEAQSGEKVKDVC